MRHARFAQRVLPWLLLAALTLPAGSSRAQSDVLSGVVRLDATGDPVGDALVFVDRTTLQTTSGADGTFAVRRPPQAAFTLIAVSEGRVIGTRFVTAATDESELVVHAQRPKPPAAGGSAASDDRTELLKLMRDGMFTWSAFGQKCTIENPEVIRVAAGDETDETTAQADAPVVIVNAALGYRMTWFDFEYSGTPAVPFWRGRILFEPLPESHGDSGSWKRNREFAYRASFRHFVWTLAHDRLGKEFFRAFHVQQPGKRDEINPIDEMGRHGMSGNRLMPLLREGYEEGTHQLTFNGWVYVTNRFGIGPDRQFVERYFPPSDLRGYLMSDRGDASSWLLLNFSTLAVDPTGAIIDYPVRDKLVALGDMGMRRVDHMLPNDWLPD